MATVESLLIEIGADVRDLRRDLKAGSKSVDKFEKRTVTSVSTVTSSFRRLAPAIAATVAVLGVREVIQTAASFEKLEASLKTVTGSVFGATKALDMIKKTASETPFSVQQLTEGFIKLKAMGLDPSERSLISYGNTASAMGKDLSMMIEAVADAATGEFERLKEFGIKASSEGDKVRFTFQGVTTEVQKEADAIQQYLLGIGETQFAGAMKEQMDTLGGGFSNLGDSADRLFVAIGEAGLTDATKGLTGAFASLLSKSAEVLEIWGDYEPPPYDVLKGSIFEYNKQLDMLTEQEQHWRNLLALPLEPAALKHLQGELARTQDQIRTMEGALASVQGVVTAEQEAADPAAQAKAAAEAEVTRLAELYALTDEMLEARQAGEITRVNEHHAAKVIAEQEHQAMLGDTVAKGIVQRRKFEEMNGKQSLKFGLNMITQLTAGAARGNKLMFKLNKAAAIANATMKGAEAVQSAYAWGNSWGGPAGGAAMAALAVAATAANIQAISATSYGGGGSGGSAGGGGAAIPSNALSPGVPVTETTAGTAEPTQQATVIIQGVDPAEMFTGQQMRDLAERLTENTTTNAVFV